MAAVAAVSSRALAAPSCGLRQVNRLDNVAPSHAAVLPRVAQSSRVVCLNPSIVISGSTALSLALGRFAFRPFWKRTNEEQGRPVQNGVTHEDAGDSRAAEVSSVLKSNDPEGFSVVEVLAWGAIGHAIAYFILATASNGYEPKF
ncbi:photosystem I subunit V [Klebsormidium nitens]|uniref:Photosystem I reaction center subunit V, chloroplastic n=1 Tax=Klebsormidium nitens TaxID=105231 RepID=A0A1Y1I8N7_KLENI|nr:photosystem I subunit V [Klebsormidium nitens]|eukprot:GAQ86893.1 photosystem I subunit V [Klebsormidium nitens]